MVRSRLFYIIMLIINTTLMSVACTQKALPVITDRGTRFSPQKNISETIIPDLELGKVVFTNRCGKCHDLPIPEQFSVKKWEGILSYMIPKARLDTVQGVHVTAYLKENALK